MEQKSLASWLKVMLIGVGICGLIIYGLFFPLMGSSFVEQYPEFGGWFYPWLMLLWLTGIPCYAALAIAWKIAANIGGDRSFCMENGAYLKWISILAAGDALLFFIGNLIYWLLNINFPLVVIASFIICFFGVALSVVFAALSHLVVKAASLQEQSDWTI